MVAGQSLVVIGGIVGVVLVVVVVVVVDEKKPRVILDYHIWLLFGDTFSMFGLGFVAFHI